jgi:hypothetical protein
MTPRDRCTGPPDRTPAQSIEAYLLGPASAALAVQALTDAGWFIVRAGTAVTLSGVVLEPEPDLPRPLTETNDRP